MIVRGTGLSEDEWTIVQQRAAEASAAAAQVSNALASVANGQPNAALTTAFEKAFGEGSATADNLNTVAENLAAVSATLSAESATVINKISASDNRSAEASFGGPIDLTQRYFDSAGESAGLVSAGARNLIHEGGHQAVYFGSGHHPNVRDVTTGSEYIRRVNAFERGALRGRYGRDGSVMPLTPRLGDPGYVDCLVTQSGGSCP